MVKSGHSRSATTRACPCAFGSGPRSALFGSGPKSFGVLAGGVQSSASTCPTPPTTKPCARPLISARPWAWRRWSASSTTSPKPGNPSCASPTTGAPSRWRSPGGPQHLRQARGRRAGHRADPRASIGHPGLLSRQGRRGEGRPDAGPRKNYLEKHHSVQLTAQALVKAGIGVVCAPRLVTPALIGVQKP